MRVNKVHEFVIIGGGIAGLCAANRLADLGAKVTLIEAGDYPTHKVCGEFLSPECLEVLRSWGIISPVVLRRARFNTPSSSFAFTFPTAASSLSHMTLDPMLVEYGHVKGVDIRKLTKVVALRDMQESHGVYELDLSSGVSIKAAHLIIATGRLPQFAQQAPRMLYMGIKAHFEGISLHDCLEMHSFPGAYLGISAIEEGKTNLACLAKMQQVQASGSAELFMQYLLEHSPVLRNTLAKGKMSFPKWLTCTIPSFGLKTTPNWRNAYFIGDAAGTIPPASGEGMAMGILSGCMAAEYAIAHDFIGFKKAWKKRYAAQLQWGKLLHEIMLRPFLAQIAFKGCDLLPGIPNRLFCLTRDYSAI